MTVVAYPELAAAIRTYLRESSVLAQSDYVGNAPLSIVVGLPKDKNNQINVPVFSSMIVIQPGRGGRGPLGLALHEERVDIFSYGATAKQCNKIWRALAYYLNPDEERTVTSFTRNNCRVLSAKPENGPLELVDDTMSDWPYTLSTYLFTYCGVPTS